MAQGLCSIIIPVHNKAALTRQCLESLFALRSEVAFEVIVVDDASSDSTPALVESYGDRVRGVRLDRNAGFATACNAGAAAAEGDCLVFLNNDTIPLEGWLDALHAHAEEHPAAAAVGSRLLFPDGTIQHAGVVFTVSGDPLHIYAGFPAEHPAVTRSRRFQAVTAACLLIRREVFDEVDGFDTDYHNDLEDVDLCLRLGERGYEVHYCHTSVLYHLESASRAFRFHQGRSVEVYRERWGTTVRSDEFDYYCEDGLLDLLRYSPELVTMNGGRRRREAELLQIRSRQMLALLRETVLASSFADERTAADGAPRARTALTIEGGGRRAVTRRPGRRARGRRTAEAQVAGLRTALAGPVDGHEPPPEAAVAVAPERAPRPGGYAGLVMDVADVAAAVTPQGATVLVVSKGDEKLVDLPGRRAWHFPRAADGRYRGYYPAGDEDALSHLDELRAQGAEYLVFPSVAFWWFEHYPGFARALHERFGLVARSEQVMVFELQAVRPVPVTPERISRAAYADIVQSLRRVVAAVVPAGATVMVVSRGDEELVSFPDHEGWHFPRTEDGRYAGYHPAGDDDALAHLEELRARGASHLALPATAFWWLRQYPRFARQLEERFRFAARTDSCMVFDVRAAAAPADPAQTAPAVAEVSEAEYAEIVERTRALAAASVREGATVLVVSKGDEKLLDLPGRQGWHFPRAEDGRYLGYYPAADEDAIAHLEELRAQGAEYLVLPSVGFWWLDHYPGFASHLRGRYVNVAHDPGTAHVFELVEPLLPRLLGGLLPGGSRIAVLSEYPGDVVGLEAYDPVPLGLSTPGDVIGRLRQLAAAGVGFLVLPRSSFAWLERHSEVSEYLRSHHRLVTRQRHICEIWELEPGAEIAGGGPGQAPAGRRKRFRFIPLWWGRRIRDSDA